jgi:hypothetical protein
MQRTEPTMTKQKKTIHTLPTTTTRTAFLTWTGDAASRSLPLISAMRVSSQRNARLGFEADCLDPSEPRFRASKLSYTIGINIARGLRCPLTPHRINISNDGS